MCTKLIEMLTRPRARGRERYARAPGTKQIKIFNINVRQNKYALKNGAVQSGSIVMQRKDVALGEVGVQEACMQQKEENMRRT
jgi:hypothetical protein